jgi:hypothetical protein
VLDELFRSHSAPHLVFGATEAVVIPANLSEPLSVEGLSSRSFSVFSIPVLQIPEFLEKNP